MVLRRLLCSFVFVLSGVSISLACTCIDSGVRGKLRDAGAVFSGEVIRFEELEKPLDRVFFYKAVFRVEKQWKGAKQSEITTFVSFQVPGLCSGLDVRTGEKFLIYAEKRKGNYFVVRDCAPSRLLKDAGDEVKKLDSLWYRFSARLYPYPKL